MRCEDREMCLWTGPITRVLNLTPVRLLFLTTIFSRRESVRIKTVRVSLCGAGDATDVNRQELHRCKMELSDLGTQDPASVSEVGERSVTDAHARELRTVHCQVPGQL